MAATEDDKVEATAGAPQQTGCHGPTEKKTKKKAGAAKAERGETSTGRRYSTSFEAFYRANLVATGLVDGESDWERFLDCLNAPLPTTFWITPTACDADEVREYLQAYQHRAKSATLCDEVAKHELGANTTNSREASVEGSWKPARAADALRVSPLVWVPENMAWCVDIPKAVLRKDASFKPLHQFLIWHTERGTINRQEEVSMLPVALLDIRAGHRCLDMCAAPGSKTAQMLADLAWANFQSGGRGLESSCSSKVKECRHTFHGRIDYAKDEGVVVANELSVERLGMLVHQIARHQSLYPLALFTSHDARFFPSICTADGPELRFDRILCDVMCSGDGTLRKAPHLWREWHPKQSLELHSSQLSIALRAARLLKVGGRMVYSTCSMSPIENEAVVAELLRATQGCLVLVDASSKIEPLRCCKGLRSWQVAHPKTQCLYANYAAATSAEGEDEPLLQPGHFPPLEDTDISLALPRCLRLLPHHNDTGGFFIAVFDKVCELTNSSPQQEEAAAEPRRKCSLPRPYDSDEDVDGEEEERQRQLRRLEDAVTNGRSEQERAKACARRERAKNSGCLSRELARYVPVEKGLADSGSALRSFYACGPEFPTGLLFCRYHLELGPDGVEVQPHQGDPNQLLLCAQGVADLLLCGTGAHAKRKLKILTGGLRAFEKDRFEVSDSSSQYRMGQEAVELMLPYLKARVVALSDTADTRRLLRSGSGKSAPVDALVSAERSELEELSPGGCILLLRIQYGETPSSLGKWLPVSALRTKRAVNIYISDIDLPLVRKLCGVVEDETPVVADVVEDAG